MNRFEAPKFGERNLPPIQREIRFENITFTYANSTAAGRR